MESAKRARYSGIKKSLRDYFLEIKRLNKLIETLYLHIITVIERMIIYKYKNNLTGFF